MKKTIGEWQYSQITHHKELKCQTMKRTIIQQWPSTYVYKGLNRHFSKEEILSGRWGHMPTCQPYPLEHQYAKDRVRKGAGWGESESPAYAQPWFDPRHLRGTSTSMDPSIHLSRPTWQTGAGISHQASWLEMTPALPPTKEVLHDCETMDLLSNAYRNAKWYHECG